MQFCSYINKTVNQFQIKRGVLSIHACEVVGFAFDSGCTYCSPIAFPDVVNAGICVAKSGNSSVRYEIALYRNDDALPAQPVIWLMSTLSAVATDLCRFPLLYDACFEP